MAGGEEVSAFKEIVCSSPGFHLFLCNSLNFVVFGNGANNDSLNKTCFLSVRENKAGIIGFDKVAGSLINHSEMLSVHMK